MGQVCASIVSNYDNHDKENYCLNNNGNLLHEITTNNCCSDEVISSSLTIQAGVSVLYIDEQCHGALPTLLNSPHLTEGGFENNNSNVNNTNKNDVKNLTTILDSSDESNDSEDTNGNVVEDEDERLFQRLLTDRDHSTDITLTDPIVREVNLSLEYWNTKIAPRTNTELANKVNVRLVPILQYLDQSIKRYQQLSSSCSSSLLNQQRQYYRQTQVPQQSVSALSAVTVVASPLSQIEDTCTENNGGLQNNPNPNRTSGAFSAKVSSTLVTLPQLLGISTASQMFRWLREYGAALMLIRSASAAAGIYAQLTINRLSQLTHVSCREISAIEKIQGRVRDSANIHLCKIARYIMSSHHPWIQEPSSLVLENVIKHRIGLILSHQMYNVEHEKRHVDVIRRVLEGLTLHNGQCITEFNADALVSPGLSSGSLSSITSLLALEPFTWAREVPVVVHNHHHRLHQTSAGLSSVSSLTLNSNSICNVQVKPSSSSSSPSNMLLERPNKRQKRKRCDDCPTMSTEDDNDNAESDIKVSITSTVMHQQKQQYPHVTTSKGVSADIVVRLSEDLWIVIEAKFLSDKSNVHNKTPRMLEAKRQCEAHKDPSWKIVYIAFMGGDWEVSQLRHLQQEGFKFVWEHSPHQLGDIIIEVYRQHCQSFNVSPMSLLQFQLSEQVRAMENDSDVGSDDDIDTIVTTKTVNSTKTTVVANKRKKRKRMVDDEDAVDNTDDEEESITLSKSKMKNTLPRRVNVQQHLHHHSRRSTRSNPTMTSNNVTYRSEPVTKKVNR